MREIYGSIAGGSAFKFGLFYHKKNQCWMTGSPGKPQKLSEEEAIRVAESIRDSLVEGAQILDAHTFVSSIEDYEVLHEKPFLVLELTDTLEEAKSNEMEDADPFPYDLSDDEIVLEVKRSLGLEEYPNQNVP